MDGIIRRRRPNAGAAGCGARCGGSNRPLRLQPLAQAAEPPGTQRLPRGSGPALQRPLRLSRAPRPRARGCCRARRARRPIWRPHTQARRRRFEPPPPMQRHQLHLSPRARIRACGAGRCDDASCRGFRQFADALGLPSAAGGGRGRACSFPAQQKIAVSVRSSTRYAESGTSQMSATST